MTDRMGCALRHIQTAVDVDPWAKDEVFHVFTGMDRARAMIESEADEYDAYVDHDVARGLYKACEIMDEIMGVDE